MSLYISTKMEKKTIVLAIHQTQVGIACLFWSYYFYCFFIFLIFNITTLQKTFTLNFQTKTSTGYKFVWKWSAKLHIFTQFPHISHQLLAFHSQDNSLQESVAVNFGRFRIYFLHHIRVDFISTNISFNFIWEPSKGHHHHRTSPTGRMCPHSVIISKTHNERFCKTRKGYIILEFFHLERWWDNWWWQLKRDLCNLESCLKY